MKNSQPAVQAAMKLLKWFLIGSFVGLLFGAELAWLLGRGIDWLLWR